MSIGYIYIVMVREFLKQQQPVVKCGCTKDISARLGQYPKGSKLIYCQLLDDHILAERKMLQMMKDMFIHRKDIGREYFEGCVSNIVNCVQNHMKEPITLFDADQDSNKPESVSAYTSNLSGLENSDPDSNPAPDTAPTADMNETCQQPSITDPDVLIQKFMDMCKFDLSRQILKSIDVYERYQIWAFENKCIVGRNVSHKRFTQGLKHLYNVKVKAYRFEDGVSQAIFFGNLGPIETEVPEPVPETKKVSAAQQLKDTIQKQKEEMTCLLDSILEVTGQTKTDVVHRDQIYTLCSQITLVSNREFSRQFQEYCINKRGVVYVNKTDVGGIKNVKGVARGVRLKQSMEPLLNASS